MMRTPAARNLPTPKAQSPSTAANTTSDQQQQQAIHSQQFITEDSIRTRDVFPSPTRNKDANHNSNSNSLSLRSSSFNRAAFSGTLHKPMASSNHLSFGTAMTEAATICSEITMELDDHFQSQPVESSSPPRIPLHLQTTPQTQDSPNNKPFAGWELRERAKNADSLPTVPRRRWGSHHDKQPPTRKSAQLQKQLSNKPENTLPPAFQASLAPSAVSSIAAQKWKLRKQERQREEQERLQREEQKTPRQTAFPFTSPPSRTRKESRWLSEMELPPYANDDDDYSWGDDEICSVVPEQEESRRSWSNHTSLSRFSVSGHTHRSDPGVRRGRRARSRPSLVKKTPLRARYHGNSDDDDDDEYDDTIRSTLSSVLLDPQSRWSSHTRSSKYDDDAKKDNKNKKKTAEDNHASYTWGTPPFACSDDEGKSAAATSEQRHDDVGPAEAKRGATNPLNTDDHGDDSTSGYSWGEATEASPTVASKAATQAKAVEPTKAKTKPEIGSKVVKKMKKKKMQKETKSADSNTTKAKLVQSSSCSSSSVSSASISIPTDLDTVTSDSGTEASYRKQPLRSAPTTPPRTIDGCNADTDTDTSLSTTPTKFDLKKPKKKKKNSSSSNNSSGNDSATTASASSNKKKTVTKSPASPGKHRKRTPNAILKRKLKKDLAPPFPKQQQNVATASKKNPSRSRRSLKRSSIIIPRNNAAGDKDTIPPAFRASIKYSLKGGEFVSVATRSNQHAYHRKQMEKKHRKTFVDDALACILEDES